MLAVARVAGVDGRPSARPRPPLEHRSAPEAEARRSDHGRRESRLRSSARTRRRGAGPRAARGSDARADRTRRARIPATCAAAMTVAKPYWRGFASSGSCAKAASVSVCRRSTPAAKGNFVESRRAPARAASSNSRRAPGRPPTRPRRAPVRGAQAARALACATQGLRTRRIVQRGQIAHFMAAGLEVEAPPCARRRRAAPRRFGLPAP